jgi:hypothetical protein
MNDHRKYAQYSGVRDGMRILTAMSNQYFGADRCFREIDSSSCSQARVYNEYYIEWSHQ